MIIQNYMALLGGVAAGLVLMPCAIAALPVEVSVVSEAKVSTVPYYSEWPSLESAIKKDPQIEARIAEILSRMTLGEKVGQMIMPEYRQVTPSEAKQYKIGSVLNGGGGWPNEDKYATAQEWAKQADSYWLALDEAYAGRGFRIPFMWATDAVHGHNNVYGATLFPHNIGLGAANNPDLLRQIGEVTAIEVAATGIDLTFAPTVAVPRDYRWGRVYEGYSESPDITYQYAPAIVEGLQGNQQQLQTESKVIATVKHWLGDGGTHHGVDRGVNNSTEDQLRNIHALGYFSAIEAGAQVVMTSFNSWQEIDGYDDSGDDENHSGKLHGSRYLVTDILKEKLGFDGIVVTDWNGHGEVKGCTNANCPQAVLAGNDLFMVTDNKDWKGFYRNVIKQVRSGEIPMSRIDDAVTRILRVKMRAGLWFKPRPSYRLYAGDESLLGAEKHRMVARQAVSESLVLLKNNNQVLPLNSNNQTYLVVGSASNDMQKQTGGWTLTWQGNENRRTDYLYGETVLEAFIEHVGEKRVFTDPATAPMDAIAIVVMGEDPYAEMFGDIKQHQSIAYSELKASYKRDLRLLEQLKRQGFEVVTLFFSGRPLYITPELNLSDAFVAGWLPGTEAIGITDVLFGVNGKDFTGRLSFSWPSDKCVSNVSRLESRIPDYAVPENERSPQDSPPLFEYGYGLNYQKANQLDEIDIETKKIGCGTDIQTTKATHSFEIFGRLASDQFVPKVSGQVTQWKGTFISRSKVTEIGTAHTTPINYKHQQDALSVSLGQSLPMQFYLQTPDKKGVDLTDYLFAGSDLEFDIVVFGSVPQSLKLASHCVYPCGAIASIGKELSKALLNRDEPWLTVKVPLSCLAENGVDFSDLNTPFLLYTDEPFDFDIGEVRYVPERLQTDDQSALTLSCLLFDKIK
ncbi:glycoside hydrolase family 3 protein [Vibrio fortis]|uniref:glycoside hydrolase family 3 protein n=1 Tax=Vibrio fortis TaxID=212667 RepID=UPI0036F1F48C